MKFLKLSLIVLAAVFSLITSDAFAKLAPNQTQGIGTGLADSPWPLFGHDSRHTNVSPFEIGKDKKELLWSYKTGASIESSPVVGKDGTIYFGSHDGSFYAINKDGSLKWKKELTKPIYDPRWNVSKAIMASPAIASDGTVYINTASGYLHALNPGGDEKWRFVIKWENDFWNGPNIGADGIIYIGTARDDKGTESKAGVYAISPEGKKLWFYPESSGVTVVPTVTDDTIYAGAAETTTNKGRIIALDRNGKKKWQFDLEQWLEGSASIGADGTIYSGSKEGYVYAINPAGTEKWRFKTNSGISAMPTIGDDGNVYIGSWDGNFYALEGKTGKEIWRLDVKVGRDPKLFEGYPGKETITTNASLSKDGVLIFADVFDTVYAIDTAGKELWRWKSEDSTGFASSPAISKDGVIYIGGEDGHFYALGEKEDSKSETNSSTGQQNKSAKSQSNIVNYYLAAAAFVLISAGVVFALYLRKKKQNQFENEKLKTLLIILVVTLFMMVIGGALVYLFYPLKQESENKDSRQNPIENEQTNQNEDEFAKNATRVPGPVEIWVREFGEVARSCAGKGCGGAKDTCVRWNKTKDDCYETVKTMPATSDRYEIYCNMVIVNQDQKKSANVSLNLNYTTADGTEHLVKKDSYDIKHQSGQSLGWSYDVDSNNIGKCGYSDLVVKEGK